MAFLTDFHCHTRVSPDSAATLYDMAMAEYAAGVRWLCITDHCDTVDWRTLDYYPACRTVAARDRAELEAVRDALPADLHIRLGLELAELQFYPELTGELSCTPGLDFILGSHHITKEYGDYHALTCYDDHAFLRRMWELYLDNLQWVADKNYFDVMAHIGYVRRYAMAQGIDTGLTLAEHGDRIERLLKTLIANGRGIEINCSGLRDGCGPFPSEEILRLYRSLDGEIVTTGSDAHRPQVAAACVTQGQEILKSIGFRYVAVFTGRRPEFIPI